MSTYHSKIQAAIILLLLAIVPVVGFSQAKPYGQKILTGAQKVIKKHNAGESKTSSVVKVVYFHGKDTQPLANWNERLDRVLASISNFYAEEFKRYGFKSDGVNFERSGNKYVITVIEGDRDSKAYSQHTGTQIQSEIFKKAGGKIDFSNDHVLVITGLSYVRADGVYEFHSPYEGSGSSERGVCFASDCELLDPKLLTDTVTRMKFIEDGPSVREYSLAGFNGLYLGGMAHEMGHMFGLHHDAGNPAELDASTISLMGSGNSNFRGYLWGHKTAHLSASGILQLLSHPVFTKSRKNINIHTSLTLSDIKFENADNSLLLKADISASTAPYALAVLIHSDKVDEYRNESSVYPISSTGPINIHLKKWPVGAYQIRFIFMFPNGTIDVFYKAFHVNTDGAELIDLPGAGTVDINEYYTRLSKKEQTAVIKQKMKILESIIHPAPPIAADTFKGDTLYLSDAKWDVGSVGWEKPARNYFTTEEEALFFLQNQSKIFEKGIYAHSPSVYTFRLNKKWKRFSAIVGLRDGASSIGSAKFTVIGDGKVLYESPALKEGQRANFNIDVTNINIIELKANGAEGHNDSSWAMWLEPMVAR